MEFQKWCRKMTLIHMHQFGKMIRLELEIPVKFFKCFGRNISNLFLLRCLQISHICFSIYSQLNCSEKPQAVEISNKPLCFEVNCCDFISSTSDFWVEQSKTWFYELGPQGPPRVLKDWLTFIFSRPSRIGRVTPPISKYPSGPWAKKTVPPNRLFSDLFLWRTR